MTGCSRRLDARLGNTNILRGGEVWARVCQMGKSVLLKIMLDGGEYVAHGNIDVEF